MDFYKPSIEYKNKVYYVSPSFISKPSKDLMIRGKAFYAVWNEQSKLWSTDLYDLINIIDTELDQYVKELRKSEQYKEAPIIVKYMSDHKSHVLKDFIEYTKMLPDRYKPLDSKIVFLNDETEKEDYASRKLSYPLVEGDTTAWDTLVGRLYSPSEKEKIEWSIGALVTGDSKKIQKFLLFYGDPGTGKSTVLDIITGMFAGYHNEIDAKAITSTSDSFSLTCLATDPLILYQHDCKLSRIEDNSKLNSLVSHESMIVNEKFKAPYTVKPQAFIFLGTNEPVKITDSKSGIIRRLIDVMPTGETFKYREYSKLIKEVQYEYGAIAYKCKELYLEKGKSYYSDYRPIEMMYRTDPFFNFVEYYKNIFEEQDSTDLKQAYEMYKTYIAESGTKYEKNRSEVRDALKDYFREHLDEATLPDGSFVRHYYSGFRAERFTQGLVKKDETKEENWLRFELEESLFDALFKDQPAQEANDEEKPRYKWVNVLTKLSDIDTKNVHYVRVPENLIVIDFDIKDGDQKSFEKNLAAASQWPPTYAELSKSGQGIHLHYIYKGDPTTLSKIFADNVEIKVFTGNASLRRKLTKCNDLPIATISSGLPLKGKGGKKLVDAQVLKDEKQLRALIKGNLQKKYMGATKPSMDFIYKLCNDAYESKMHYDISDMGPAIMAFAANSSNNADYCLDIFSKLQLKSDEPSTSSNSEYDQIVFFDVEVFPNLFLVNWKFPGKDEPCHHMINPTPQEIEELIKYRLVGFNCRRYDNHILYGRLIGETEYQLFLRSQLIIGGSRNGFFGEAYNLSYTDIYDFCSEKMSLKKWEIRLKIHHQELGFKWDEPVPEDKWLEVSDYCDNDVISTEAVWDDRQADFIARKILADVCGMTVNDTTNSLTTKLIFEGNKNPQSEFNYRNMGEAPPGKEPDILNPRFVEELSYPEYTVFYDGKPVFPGYYYDHGKSYYRGEEFGEGGYVFANPGIYWDAWVEDVASMHPSSIIAENLFGTYYTARFKELVQARIHIKHKEFDKCKELPNLGKTLAKYLDDPDKAKALAGALKIAINSVYGLTSAKFDNAFRDPRNVDNIVAKRGELFMINLKHEVTAKGFKVVHIKTDSIKIEKPNDYILNFVVEYGKLYGYNFEIENHFDRVALVNDAVFIAKRADDDPEWLDECEKAKKKADAAKKPYIPPTQWTATGAQFAVSYVFKSLFSHEEIDFEDMCETKSCNSALYLDFNENLSNDEHNYIFVGKVGRFCPVLDGCGGAQLVREQEDKYNAVSGTKGWRFKESEVVKNNNLENQINLEYYRKLCDEAVTTIEKFGSFEEFAA